MAVTTNEIIGKLGTKERELFVAKNTKAERTRIEMAVMNAIKTVDGFDRIIRESSINGKLVPSVLAQKTTELGILPDDWYRIASRVEDSPAVCLAKLVLTIVREGISTDASTLMSEHDITGDYLTREVVSVYRESMKLAYEEAGIPTKIEKPTTTDNRERIRAVFSTYSPINLRR